MARGTHPKLGMNPLEIQKFIRTEDFAIRIEELNEAFSS
jgi:hypothetical protein